MLGEILLVFGFVFAAVAAFFVTSLARGAVTIHFGWLAIAFWILSVLLGGHGFGR